MTYGCGLDEPFPGGKFAYWYSSECSPLHCAGEESYTEEEEDGDDGEGEEEVDTPGFAPFPHRPMIRSEHYCITLLS